MEALRCAVVAFVGDHNINEHLCTLGSLNPSCVRPELFARPLWQSSCGGQL